MKDTISDAALMKGLAGGDVGCIARLFERHASAVHSTALGVLGRDGEADDVVQDVFLQLWTLASAYDPDRGRLLTWLQVMARSRAVDRLRRSRLREGTVVATAAASLAPAAAERLLIDRERTRAVRLGVIGLTRNQRRVIEMTHFRGLTVAATAAALGQPLGSVKTTQRAALHALRAVMRPPRDPQPFSMAGVSARPERPINFGSRRRLDAQRLSGICILSVDDDEETIRLVESVLRRAGAEVMTAHSSHEAVELLEQAWPHALLADISMPGEDGYSLLRRARAVAARLRRRLPAAAFTAYAREDDCARAHAAGFEMHLVKPLAPAILIERVAQLVSA